MRPDENWIWPHWNEAFEPVWLQFQIINKEIFLVCVNVELSGILKESEIVYLSVKRLALFIKDNF